MNEVVLIPMQLNDFQTFIENCFESFLLKQGLNFKLPEPEPEIIGIDKVCEILNLKERTIYGLVWKRKIPCLKVEGKKALQFNRTEIMQWKQNRFNPIDKKASEYVEKNPYKTV
jgi:excisionase family DNA binding protein